MGWPYRFLDLDEAQLQARRQKLDRYGLIAQLSTLVPILLFLLYRLIAWAVARATGSSRGTYAAIPGSPIAKQERLSLIGSWSARARRIAWWLGDDVLFLARSWGPRDQILGGVAWAIWLFILCVVDTGDDYIHFSRRFTIVAVSQFPVQYLLSLKRINPIALALNSSHEEVNRWHRVLGRITYFFVVTHALLYVNYYYQKQILGEKFTSLVPILGLILITCIHLLQGTALKFIRTYSYRIFFITHVVVAFAVPPLIYFHAHHAALYVWESLAVLILDILTRRLTTTTAETTATLIPGTDLIKLTTTLPATKFPRFAKTPGTHVYISIPPSSRPNKNLKDLIFEVSFNPFSIASTNETNNEVTLVARRQNGPMTRALARFADMGASVKLGLDGPYGCAKNFPNLAGQGFDRVLLVAGGVGATFILPLYRWLTSESGSGRVQMVWAVRGLEDVSWVEGKGVLDDAGVRVFVTGGAAVHDSEDEEMEMGELDPRRKGRPDLGGIVDEMFRLGVEERVAVLVCGPEGMVREVRACVGTWVGRGRRVWWHSENFAW